MGTRLDDQLPQVEGLEEFLDRLEMTYPVIPRGAGPRNPVLTPKPCHSERSEESQMPKTRAIQRTSLALLLVMIGITPVKRSLQSDN
jgi:hypothetical protein